MQRAKSIITGAVALTTLALAGQARADCTEDDYPNPCSYFEFEDVLTGFVGDTVGTHVGVVYGGPGTAVGIVGNAVAWDGVNDYALLDEYAELKDNMTFATWVQYHSPNNTGALMSKYLSPDHAWQLGTYSTPRRITATLRQEGLGGAKQILGTDTTTIYDQWHHVAMTYDGQVLALYEDGALIGSTAWPSSAPIYVSDVLVRLGARYGGGIPYVHADMDETALWNEALTGTQVSDLYLRGNA